MARSSQEKKQPSTSSGTEAAEKGNAVDRAEAKSEPAERRVDKDRARETDERGK